MPSEQLVLCAQSASTRSWSHCAAGTRNSSRSSITSALRRRVCCTWTVLMRQRLLRWDLHDSLLQPLVAPWLQGLTLQLNDWIAPE